ncbi:YolD-like family protein [Butyrivibrio sp. ob235]|uniref:YolD-like family protein n=2 Tax=Butyrivibrio TaxID=830 RepID=UPI00041B185E|nr:YolD-like family protein [Butyrivibrio sp. ob235]
MPLQNRAAQFMPFAALVGYDDEVSEAGRFTREKIELTEEKQSELNEKLTEMINSHEPGDTLSATVTYFVPDGLKDGGEYVTKQVNIGKIDTFKRCLVLDDKSVILIEDIISIE